MNISIFLAKLFGFYLLIVGLVYFTKRKFMREAIKDFYQSPALIAVASVMNVIIGLLIILNHNVWEFSWKVVITILGYLSLAKGVINLYAPEFGKKFSQAVVKKDVFIFSGVISLALGVYLLYHGFFYSVQEAAARGL